MRNQVKWVIGMVCVSLLMFGCAKGGKEETAAAKYPTKPIQMIVPMPAGGASDLAARAMEKVSKDHLGQQLVIVNKPGAGGALGFNDLVESKGDGYTVGLTATNMLLQPLYGGTKHNYPEATEPIAQAVFNNIAVAVSADAPWKTLAELIQYVKQNPGQLKYAHTNVGSLPHVVSYMFMEETGTKMEAVPFQGGADALTAFLGGHVQVNFAQFSEMRNHVKEGKVRILAVASEKRLPNFPDIPTFKEQGVNIVAATWFGVAAPKGMSEAVKGKLAEGFKNIINDPSFKKMAEDIGYYVEYLGPNEFSAKWKKETEAYGKIIKSSGLGEQMSKKAN